MQDYIKMNGSTIKQPDESMKYSFETTYQEDASRSYAGVMHATPLFTAEAFEYAASYVSIAEMSQILQIVAKGNPFTLHYFSPYYGVWRDGTFRVAKGSLNIGTLEENGEYYESLSFNMVGDDPI